jgi:hypothetical protein
LLVITKRYFLLFFLLFFGQSTNLCASNRGWISSIKSFFSSIKIPQTFKKPTLSKRWLSIGALAITGSIFAWRYFQKQPFNAKQKSLLKDRENLEGLEGTKITWTDIKETPTTRGAPTEAENQFKVNDVVKVVGNSAGITLTEFPTMSVNQDYDKQIGIIRTIMLGNSEVEMRVLGKDGKSFLNFTTLFTIPLQKLKKMVLVNPDATDTVGTMVKFALFHFSPKSLIGYIDKVQNENYQILYYAQIDSQTKNAVDPRTFSIDRSLIQVIQDPDTKQPIIIQ